MATSQSKNTKGAKVVHRGPSGDRGNQPAIYTDLQDQVLDTSHGYKQPAINNPGASQAKVNEVNPKTDQPSGWTDLTFGDDPYKGF